MSPDGSLEDTSSSNASASQSLTGVAQHHKHLQNAFESFEKLFTLVDEPVDDASPPPSRSMAMVVSSALNLNTKLRNLLGSDNPPSERSLKALLKASDEQIRSLTECILALSPLAPKKPSKRMSIDINGRGHAQYSSEPISVQMPTPANSARSMSPIQRISVPSELFIQENQNCVEHIDGLTQRVSPTLPNDQSPPPLYYNQTQRPRSNRNSRPSSPSLSSENMMDQQYMQQTSPRILEYRELRSRRISGGAYNYSGTIPTTSTSPSPPPIQPSLPHYDPSAPNGSRVYYDRNELPRMQRYNHQQFNNALPTSTVINSHNSHQRTTTRPISYMRPEESSYSINPVRNSSVYRSTSGRSYSSRFPGDEFVSNQASMPRQQSRMYEFTRRADPIPPIERRQTPAPEAERRNGYDQNVYSENAHERDYIARGNDSSSINNTNNNYRQRLMQHEQHNQEVQNDGNKSNEENQSRENCCESNNIYNNTGLVDQDNNQANSSSDNNMKDT